MAWGLVTFWLVFVNPVTIMYLIAMYWRSPELKFTKWSITINFAIHLLIHHLYIKRNLKLANNFLKRNCLFYIDTIITWLASTIWSLWLSKDKLELQQQAARFVCINYPVWSHVQCNCYDRSTQLAEIRTS